MKSNEFGTEWKKNYESLEEKRKKALEFLGDRHILKGGKYTRTNDILGKK